MEILLATAEGTFNFQARIFNFCGHTDIGVEIKMVPSLFGCNTNKEDRTISISYIASPSLHWPCWRECYCTGPKNIVMDSCPSIINPEI